MELTPPRRRGVGRGPCRATGPPLTHGVCRVTRGRRCVVSCALTLVERAGMLINVWAPNALVSLKEAGSATARHTPREMHQPRDTTTKRPSTPYEHHSTQPIAKRTRSHAAPSRAPRKQVTTAPRKLALKHRMIQAPAPTRFTNCTRRHVAVTVGHTEIQGSGANMHPCLIK